MEFGNDGVAAVGIDDADKGIDAACFVHIRARRLVFAEIENLVAKAVAFLQNPEVFQGQIDGGKGFFTDKRRGRRHISHELFVIERNFKDGRVLEGSGQNGGIDFA